MLLMMFRHLLSAVIFCLAGLAAGKDSGFLVRVWQSDEGLPGNVVRSIGQSTDGFLWIATAEGIARFDGVEFESVIAIGADRGRPLDLFRIFAPDDGSVWVATRRQGLFRVNLDGLEEVIADYADVDSGLITRLFTWDGDTYAFRNGGWWRLLDHGAEPVGKVTEAWAKARKEQERQCVARGRIDGSNEPVRLVDRNEGVWSLAERSLSYEGPGGGESRTVEQLEGAITASDMLEDREGNLWIACPLQGLVRVRHARVGHVPVAGGSYDASALTCLREPDGTWWIANRNGGLDFVRDGVVGHVPIVTSEVRAVSCLHLDRAGDLWVATRDGSVFIYNRALGKVRSRFDRGPRISQVSSIVEDSKGRLWFAGRRGIFRASGDEAEDFSQSEGAAGAEFSSLAVAGDDTLFAGTEYGRVLRFDGDRFTALEGPGGEGMSWVSGIVPGNNGEVWVATLGAGLYLWKDGDWHRFAKDCGLPDERLTGLVMESDDSLWMGSLGGIIRVASEDLLGWLADRDRVISWMNLDRTDGMATRECSGGAQPGVFRDAKGELWFPTTGGLAGVDPSGIAINRVPPPVHFRPVEIDGVPHPVDDGRIVAGPGRVRLGFGYTGVSLTAPEKVTYRLQMEGLDPHPVYVGTERSVDYQAVPPGRYRLKVTAINGDGIATSAPALLRITVKPHYWQTAWFITLSTVLVLLLTLSVGWLLARRRMRRRIEALRLRGVLEAERTRISRDLHDELGASLTEVSILSALTAERNRDEKLDSSLTKLTQRTKQVVGALDEIVWATSPEQDSLRSLVEYLAFYAREFLKTVEIPLHADVARDVPDLAIGPRRRHNVMLAAREAINNAVKHARPGLIHLRIAIEDHRLVVTVTDDGKGFDPATTEPGNGLVNLRKRMAESGGTFEIASSPGAGSTATITLPLPH